MSIHSQSSIAEFKTANPTGLAEGVTLREGDVFRRTLSLQGRGIGSISERNLWVDGVIPYRLDPTLPQHSVDAINSAIAHWNKVAGITFKSIDEVAGEQRSIKDSVLFKNNAGCASWVGRQGGEQQVWVGPNCTTGSVMHEIGHVLGLEHEHTRPDRDQHITIHWENISADKTHNFDIATPASTTLGEYDYGSIMHYGRYNFSFAGQPTITPIFGSANSIGQRTAPSAGDLAAVSTLYAADLSVVAHLYSTQTGSEAAIHVANNDQQGAHNIEVRVSIDPSLVSGYSNNGWSCATDSFNALICTLDRISGSSSSVLTLDVEPNDALTSYQAVVRAKTPDMNSANNTNVSSIAFAPTKVEPPIAAALPQDDETTPIFAGSLAFYWWALVLLFVRLQRQSRKD
ncbi:MAG: M12 family metallopeptidase [Granulosicoccus sp.]